MERFIKGVNSYIFMLESIIFMGNYKVSINQNKVTLPVSFRNSLASTIGLDYYVLISQETEDGLKYLKFEPISKLEYDNLAQQMSNAKASEKEEFFAKLKAEVNKQGRVNLKSKLVDFLNSQEGDKYYFLGCGRYFELHKKYEKEIFDMVSWQEESDD